MLPLLLLLAAPADARELQNDDCACDGSDETTYAQQGFVDGECWASVYVPSAGDYPFTPEYVTMLIGGTGGQDGIFDLTIYEVDENNQPTQPISGTEAFQAIASDTSLSQLWLADLKISLPEIKSGNFAISVCLNGHSGTPAIARDDGGNDYPDRNWIRATSKSGGYEWVQSADYRVQGDWIMRVGWEGDTDTDTDSDTDSDTDTDTDTDGDLEIYAIAPTSAPEGEAVDVVIFGEGFQSGAIATIGGLTLTGGSVQDSGTISGRTPTALPAGTHDVGVTNPDGSGAYLAGAFTVEAGKGGCACAATDLALLPGASWLLPLGALALLRRRR